MKNCFPWRIRLVFSLMLILSGELTLLANTYYIDSIAGNNTNSGLSPNDAFYDFFAIGDNTISPGDSILFAANTSYSGFFDILFSGNKEQPVYISHYGEGAKPKLSNAGNWFVIRIQGNHIIVDGLELHSSTYTAFSVDGRNNTIQNCIMYNVPNGVSLNNSGNRVLQNTFKDLIMNVNTPGGDDDNGAIGVSVLHGGNEIAYNSFVNCIAESFDYGVDGGALEFYGDIDSVLVHHNYAENCDGFFEAGGGTIKNVEIYYNLMVNNGEIGGFHLQGKFGATIKNFQIINNTVVDQSVNQNEVLWFNGTPEPDEIKFINNLVYFDGFSRFTSGSEFIHEHNIYFSPSNNTLGFSLNNSEFNEPPGMENIEVEDYTLLENSVAINIGLAHSYQKDFNNNKIIDNPDIGAFESEIPLSVSQLNTNVPFYPNPTFGTITIKSKTENPEWSLYNINGIKLKDGNERYVDTNELLPGYYIIRIDEFSYPFVRQNP